MDCIRYDSNYIVCSISFTSAPVSAVRDACGSDKYHPATQTGSDLTSSGGIGCMIVDALDAMHIMGLTSEYEYAKR